MALVGANFPDMKAPGEAGEITNTPVKDLLEQFKTDEESSQKDTSFEKGSTTSKCATSILREVNDYNTITKEIFSKTSLKQTNTMIM